MRDFAFDLLRTICSLWIVGCWHLLDYLPNDAHFEIGDSITTTALAAFIFMSGFFLQKYTFVDLNDCYSFYKKRFLRFYILYTLSIVTLIVGGVIVGNSWFASKEQIMLSFLGLSTVFTPSPATIWFMSMLMFFYILTPLIVYNRNMMRSFSIATTIYLIFIVLHIVELLDYRMLIYFPIYMLGLYTSKQRIINQNICLLFLVVVWLIFALANVDYIFVEVIMSIVGVWVLINFVVYISKYLEKVSFIVKIVNALSYLSLCLYLFHRQIFEVLRQLCNQLDITITYPILFCMLCIAIVASFTIQKSYDMFCKLLRV